jgi:16S rRNA (cytosine1402-N4)-methyltransferase
MYHRSVLLTESVDGLAIRPDGIYVDATFGGGGHAGEILNRLRTGKLYAFDQDADALSNKPDDPRLTLINNNFRYLRNFLKLYKAVPVDGILADLGISSHQIDTAERGFSTRFEAGLDMRMDRRKTRSAKEVVNTSPEDQLARIFREYGEIRNASKAAGLVATARKSKPVETTEELKSILVPCAEKGKENKFFAQLFQALRIEVNQEIQALKEFLIQATDVLRPGGRLVVISYHSLEDKLVKNYFRAGNFEGTLAKDFYGNVQTPLKLITRKALVPDERETEENSRARSAKLRVAEKK